MATQDGFRNTTRAVAIGLCVSLVLCFSVGVIRAAFAQDSNNGAAVQEATAAESTEQGLDSEIVEPDETELPQTAPGTRNAPDEVELGASSSPLQGEQEDVPIGLRALSVLGLFIYIGIAVLLSRDRRAINWRLVGIGVGLQVLFGVLILRTSIGREIFKVLGDLFTQTLSFTAAGSELLFGSFQNNGEMMPALRNFAFDVLPTIVFFSSLMSILYHAGIMQRVVGVFAAGMRRTMGTSGAETLNAAANIFVGQTEAPLMVKPYVSKMTMSELMAVMTGGFATVAGGVMASYVSFLQDAVPDIAQHLIAASVMSAPAALVIAKILYPETETPETLDSAEGITASTESPYDNTIDAAAGGAAEGLKLALNVGAMLLAFVALVAMANYFVAYPSYIQHGFQLRGLVDSIIEAGGAIPPALAECNVRVVDVAAEAREQCVLALVEHAPARSSLTLWPVLSLEQILGWLFYPLALVSGAPFADVAHLGELYGQKTILNEFYAYTVLLAKIQDPAIELSRRTIVIASYGLCGFANLSSIAIQIGGIGSIAPERRSDLARIGLKAMIGGTLAAWMTGNVVGILA